MRPIRSVATFALAGLIGVLGIAVATIPAAASASVPASVSSVAVPAHVGVPTVISHCRFHTNKFTTYTDGCVHFINWTCRSQNHHPLNPVPDFASNACNFDVELFTHSNETGSMLCITRHTRTGRLAPRWHSFLIISGSC